MRAPGRLRVVSMLTAAALAGCSTTPLPRWTAEEASRRPQPPTVTMEFALKYADQARDAYDLALERQLRGETFLGNAMIGIGTLIAGFASFGAHRDAVTGAALLGGSTYAFGNYNIVKQRQLIYKEAQRSITCAVDVIRPFDLSRDEVKNLTDGTRYIQDNLGPVTQQIAAVEATILKVVDSGKGKEARAAAAKARDAANEMLALARETAEAGGKLQAKVRRAAGDLVGAVDKVRDEADRQIIETMPALSKIGNTVGALGTYADMFAPGANVSGRIDAALKKMDTAKSETDKAAAGAPTQTQSDKSRKILKVAYGPIDRLASQVTELNQRVRVLANAVSMTRVELAKVEPTATTQGLAACGLKKVEAPKEPEKPAEKPAEQPAPAADNALAVALKAIESVEVAGTTVGIKDGVTSLANGRAKVVATCAAKPAKPLKRDDIIAALLEEDAVEEAAAGDGSTPPASKFDIDGAAECVEAAKKAGKGTDKSAVESPLAKVQERLCVYVDGLWGNETKTALDKWRGTKNITALGGKPTPEEEKKIVEGPRVCAG